MQMHLNDCTKKELIWVIRWLIENIAGNDHCYLMRALYEVQRNRCLKILEESEHWSKLADAKLHEYILLMEPYAGRKLSEVPQDVLNRAKACLAEAGNAKERWMKLAKQTN